MLFFGSKTKSKTKSKDRLVEVCERFWNKIGEMFCAYTAGDERQEEKARQAVIEVMQEYASEITLKTLRTEIETYKEFREQTKGDDRMFWEKVIELKKSELKGYGDSIKKAG